MNSRWRRTTLRGAEVKGGNWHLSSYGPNSHVEFGGGKCSHSHRHDRCRLVCCTWNDLRFSNGKRIELEMEHAAVERSFKRGRLGGRGNVIVYVEHCSNHNTLLGHGGR